MPLFTKSKDLGVQGFILKVVNNNCSELEALVEGPRLEGRVNLVLPVLIIPVEGRRNLLADETFTATTKEFSTTGIAIVLDRPMGLDEVIVGFRWEGDMTYVRAVAKHLNPMGGGFYQLGLQMTEIVHAGDYRELASMTI